MLMFPRFAESGSSIRVQVGTIADGRTRVDSSLTGGLHSAARARLQSLRYMLRVTISTCRGIDL